MIYTFLLLIHIVSFALWFGAVAASMLVMKTLESRLTNPDSATRDEELLRTYIDLEMKLVDTAFIIVAISGAALAQFYTGWNYWTITKLCLYFLQFIVTVFYLVKYIRPIVYPCSPKEYNRWYGIFGIAFSIFTITLLFTFFGR